jgi:Dolichyl-phosphate-mannose-protein mannosyltransferase
MLPPPEGSGPDSESGASRAAARAAASQPWPEAADPRSTGSRPPWSPAAQPPLTAAPGAGETGSREADSGTADSGETGAGASGSRAAAARPRGAGRRQAAGPRQGWDWAQHWGGAWGWWLLVLVLAVQAGLSLRLVRADTAFEDEAAYLWAGHLEWSHWLHGMPVPHFAAYFSGAPVLYPPIGALADSMGGLAGARILSLVFMLGTTAVLWATASRLAGRRAAFFAAALFGIASPTLHLGAFATFDALSLLLMSVAVWIVVRADDRADATVRMAVAGTILALANAVAYSSALLDPVVILLALAVAWRSPGGKAAAARTLTLTAVTAAWLTAGVLLGGSTYATGITRTTLLRAGGTDAPLTVLTSGLAWTGIIAATALCGVAIAAGRRDNVRAWLLALLTAAALVVPLEQARLHTLDSLSKHVDIGIWFAAIAAGYAADMFIAAAPTLRQRALTATAMAIALIFPLTLGAQQAQAMATAWPTAYSFNAILRPLITGNSGRLLVEDPSIAEYYLAAGRHWQRWSSTRNIVLPSGASTGGPTTAAGVTGSGNAGTFAEFITMGYFSLVALNFADTTSLDHQIRADLKRNPKYRIIDVIPYGSGTYVIWRYGHGR